MLHSPHTARVVPQVGDALFTDATAMLQVEMGRRLMPHSLYCWKRAVSWQARRVGHTAKPPSLGCTRALTRALPYPSGYSQPTAPCAVALPNALPSSTIVRSPLVTVPSATHLLTPHRRRRGCRPAAWGLPGCSTSTTRYRRVRGALRVASRRASRSSRGSRPRSRSSARSGSSISRARWVRRTLHQPDPQRTPELCT